MQDERFNILLARLMEGELDASARGELEGLLEDSPDRARKHQRFTETLDFLDQLPLSDLEIPELEREYGTAPVANNRFATFVKVALPAAAAVLLALGGWLFYAPAAGESRSLVTHTSGQCSSGRTRLVAGKLVAGPRVRSGANSICDVRFDFAGHALVRLMENSEFSYTFENDSLNITLRSGELLIHSEKLPRRGRVSIHSPGHSMELLGTRLVLQRRAHEHFHTELLHGRARVRSAHYLFIHGLRHGLKDDHRTRMAAELPELFEHHEQFLEPGDSLRFRHHPAYKTDTRELFQKLHAHVDESKPAADHTGAHHLHPETGAKMKATFQQHPHLAKHFAAGPPRGVPAPVSPKRMAQLKEHFEHAGQQSTHHD